MQQVHFGKQNLFSFIRKKDKGQTLTPKVLKAKGPVKQKCSS